MAQALTAVTRPPRRRSPCTTKPRGLGGRSGASAVVLWCPLRGTVVHPDRHTLPDLRSSGGVGLSFRGDGGDVLGGVPGVSFGASGAVELASVDEVAECTGADAEGPAGLCGGELAGRGVAVVHAPMMRLRSPLLAVAGPVRVGQREQTHRCANGVVR